MGETDVKTSTKVSIWLSERWCTVQEWWENAGPILRNVGRVLAATLVIGLAAIWVAVFVSMFLTGKRLHWLLWLLAMVAAMLEGVLCIEVMPRVIAGMQDERKIK
jgi:hypothetical protein